MANTIAALLNGRDNNFNLIRFVAAAAVILDHSFALVAQEHRAGGPIEVETLEIGRLAVDIFFIVSGFLVTRSVMTRPTLVDYAVARVLRLVPALFVACVGLAFVLGPAVSLVSLSAYFADARPWLFVPLTSSLITHSLTLPGVFDGLPESGVIDAPLWTLRYEVLCYVLLGLLALMGVLATRRRAAVTVALVLMGYCLVTFATPLREEFSAIDSAARFILGFFTGGAFYLLADKIRLEASVMVVLAIVAAIAYGTPAYEPARQAALAYSVLWFALVPAGAIRGFNRLGDYSYGLYILCFPIQQTCVMLLPAIAPVALFTLSFPIVLAFAALSWHFVERPALSRKVWAGKIAQRVLLAARLRAPLLKGWLAPRNAASAP